MIKGYVRKQPNEILLLEIDFTDRLRAGETVGMTMESSARDRATDADVTEDILTGVLSADGAVVSQQASGGVHMQNITVTFRITTNQNNVYEDELILRVRETE